MNGTTGGTPNKTSGATMTSPASMNGTANQQPARQHVVDAEANGVAAVEAVYVRNASKSYGVGKRRAQVLRNLDMNVKKGTMYVPLHLHIIHSFKYLSREATELQRCQLSECENQVVSAAYGFASNVVAAPCCRFSS